MYAYTRPEAEDLSESRVSELRDEVSNHDVALAHLAGCVVELRESHQKMMDRLIETTTLCSAMASELARMAKVFVDAGEQ